MLPRLLLREWILTRRALVVIAGIYLAFEAYFVCRVSSPRHYMIFAAIYGSFLTLTLFIREDKFHATAWSCTMPVSRRDLVLARFLGAWILAVASLILALLLAYIVPGSVVDAAAVFHMVTLYLTAFVITIILALMLPFAIRFGILGVMIFLVGVQILGSAVLLIAVNTRGSAQPSKGMIAGGMEALAEFLAALRDLLSPFGFYLALAAALILINWLGYRLAVVLFGRREL